MSPEAVAVVVRPVVATMAAAILVLCVQAAGSATRPLVRMWSAADRLAQSPARQQWSQVSGLLTPQGLEPGKEV